MIKINPLNNNRITIMKIHNDTVIKNVNKVNKIDKVKPINNNKFSENFILSSSSFYNKMKNFQENNNVFIKSQKEPKKDVSKNLTEEDLELLQAIKNIVNTYNESILFFKNLNIYTGEYHIKRISNIIIQNQVKLSSIGIIINKEYFLQLNEDILKYKIVENKKYIHSLFDLDNGIIKRILDKIKSEKNSLLKNNKHLY
ncbi:hypothetical protein [Tepidibacter formicigenes]|jgi:hypothetical protein|uniref:Uncharacterized protein n=1 Tax=Tepidibacter formicigenes DSM 15518 TaxID=1123349 RepID=A0A1M6LYJ1_9FIRM|nr:hypothetical protein [Tepidibacter formicigenes]SHJ76269.1 hypothetical protein SAMN02744037_00781 [Tepidibacter formicigenes DSM 15518]